MALNATTLSTELQAAVGTPDLDTDFFDALAQAIVDHIVANNTLSISFEVPSGGGPFSTTADPTAIPPVLPVTADFT